MRKINVGVIGFGTIGSGVVRILDTSNDIIKKRLGSEGKIIKIADLDIETDRGIKVESNLLTTDAQEVIQHLSLEHESFSRLFQVIIHTNLWIFHMREFF